MHSSLLSYRCMYTCRIVGLLLCALNFVFQLAIPVRIKNTIL